MFQVFSNPVPLGTPSMSSPDTGHVLTKTSAQDPLKSMTQESNLLSWGMWSKEHCHPQGQYNKPAHSLWPFQGHCVTVEGTLLLTKN